MVLVSRLKKPSTGPVSIGGAALTDETWDGGAFSDGPGPIAGACDAGARAASVAEPAMPGRADAAAADCCPGVNVGRPALAAPVGSNGFGLPSGHTGVVGPIGIGRPETTGGNAPGRAIAVRELATDELSDGLGGTAVWGAVCGDAGAGAGDSSSFGFKPGTLTIKREPALFVTVALRAGAGAGAAGNNSAGTGLAAARAAACCSSWLWLRVLRIR